MIVSSSVGWSFLANGVYPRDNKLKIYTCNERVGVIKRMKCKPQKKKVQYEG